MCSGHQISSKGAHQPRRQFTSVLLILRVNQTLQYRQFVRNSESSSDQMRNRQDAYIPWAGLTGYLPAQQLCAVDEPLASSSPQFSKKLHSSSPQSPDLLSPYSRSSLFIRTNFTLMYKLPSVRVNEKLRKRILRSKITKILYDQFENYCDRFVKSEKYQSGLDTRKTEFAYEDQRIENTFKVHPPMRFPQECKASPHFLDVVIPTPLEVQAKIKSLLTNQELMEIGEDPAYYLQNEELRALNWNDTDWFEKKQTSIPKKEVPRIKSTSNLLRKPNRQYIDEDRMEKRQEILAKQQAELKELNDYRLTRFQEGHRREVEMREQLNQKLSLKYRDKISITNKRLDAREMGQLKRKEMHQEEYLQKGEVIDEYMQKQVEIEQIRAMTQKFKTMCEEKQVQEIRSQHLLNSLEKVQIYNQRVSETLKRHRLQELEEYQRKQQQQQMVQSHHSQSKSKSGGVMSSREVKSKESHRSNAKIHSKLGTSKREKLEMDTILHQNSIEHSLHRNN